MRIPLVLLLLAMPTLAFAHIDLLDPPSRETRQKFGPCGAEGSVPGDVVATYAAGETIEIQIDETVNHPGHFRVAIDLDGGDDDLAVPVCLTNCDDNRQDVPTFEDPAGVTVLGNFEDDAAAAQTLTVTLPDVACERCTLQVIQVMYDKRPYTIDGNDNYFRCADIAIEGGAPATDAGVADAGSGTDDAGASGDAGVAGADAGGASDSGTGDGGTASDAATEPGSDGGCSVGQRGRAPEFGLLVGLGLLLHRRRR